MEEEKKEKKVEVTSPKNKIIATEERFIYEKPVTLLLKEGILSLSSEEYVIYDLIEDPYFKCKGKSFSIREKKFLYDMEGKPILNVQNKILSLKGQISIFSGEDNTKLIGKIIPSSAFIKKKFNVQFHNLSTGNMESIDMKCDYYGSNCELYYRTGKEDPILICKISKEIEEKHALSGHQDDYHIEIASGVDAALMVAIAICFDEYKNDQAAN